MQNELRLSPMQHTWLLDLDGTIVMHNGYKIDGHDVLIDGANDFLRSIPREDTIIFLTSREEKYRCETEAFLRENNIRYDHIIYGLPYGERILFNDDKPSGLPVSISLRKKRDDSVFPHIFIDDTL